MNRDDVRRWRCKHSLTQAQMATRLGVGTGTVNAWESGRSVPPPYLPLVLDAVARALPRDVSGEELKLWRMSSDWTQTDVAALFGVPVATLRAWESGRNTPPPYFVIALSAKVHELMNTEAREAFEHEY